MAIGIMLRQKAVTMLFYFRATTKFWENHKIHQSKYEQGTSRTLPPHQSVNPPPIFNYTLSECY